MEEEEEEGAVTNRELSTQQQQKQWTIVREMPGQPLENGYTTIL